MKREPGPLLRLYKAQQQKQNSSEATLAILQWRLGAAALEENECLTVMQSAMFATSQLSGAMTKRLGVIIKNQIQLRNEINLALMNLHKDRARSEKIAEWIALASDEAEWLELEFVAEDSVETNTVYQDSHKGQLLHK